ncbi:hypothetical protein VTL71DRAFT_4389, partial [Oculimacula yallundae]
MTTRMLCSHGSYNNLILPSALEVPSRKHDILVHTSSTNNELSEESSRYLLSRARNHYRPECPRAGVTYRALTASSASSIAAAV